MSETNLRAALDGRLESMAGGYEVDWENVGLDEAGQLYLSQSYLTAEPTPVGIEQGGSDVLAGLMQITVNVPKSQRGKKPFLTALENITAHFPRGLRIVESGTAVTIHRVFSSAGFTDGAYYRVPVSIRYRAV